MEVQINPIIQDKILTSMEAHFKTRRPSIPAPANGS